MFTDWETSRIAAAKMVFSLDAANFHAVESKLRAAVDTAGKKEEEVHAVSALAQLLADVGRTDEAAELFENIVAHGFQVEEDDLDDYECIRETMGLAMGWYAGLVEGKGAEGMARAEKLYTRALKIDPQDPLSMGNYAIFLHRVKKEYQVREWKLCSILYSVRSSMADQEEPLTTVSCHLLIHELYSGVRSAIYYSSDMVLLEVMKQQCMAK